MRIISDLRAIVGNTYQRTKHRRGQPAHPINTTLLDAMCGHRFRVVAVRRGEAQVEALTDGVIVCKGANYMIPLELFVWAYFTPED